MPIHSLEFAVIFLGIVLLMLDAFLGDKISKRTLAILGVLGLALISIPLWQALIFGLSPEKFSELSGTTCPLAAIMGKFCFFDGFAYFFKLLALVSTAFVLLLSADFQQVLRRFVIPNSAERPTCEGIGEFFCLPLFACAGMMWMASARDLVSLFVSLELVTITFYVLVAYTRRNVASLEAGTKYLILGALSTGLLVYGIAWIFGMTGTMDLSQMTWKLAEIPTTSYTGVLFGVALVLVALGFKVGAVPMQLWIPDVYQGAPTPTTAFLSVGSKAAGFAVLVRFIQPFLASPATQKQVLLVLSIFAGATLLLGNFAAIRQTNFKRLLAYSSISNAGFILLAIAAVKNSAISTSLSYLQVIALYLAIYLITTLSAFFILAIVRIKTGSEEIEAFNGLAKRNPLLALLTTLTMASLAGLPLTAGFFGKFLVFSSAIEAELWWLVAIAAVGAATGFYYYFKVIAAMYWKAPSCDDCLHLPKISAACLTVFVGMILVFGVYPKPLFFLVSSFGNPGILASPTTEAIGTASKSIPVIVSDSNAPQ